MAMPKMPIKSGMHAREKLFFGTFITLVILALATAAAALAASNGSLTLIGFVPEEHSLSLTDASGRAPAGELPASGEDIELARIVEINNAPGVFVVTIGSKNLGLLKSPDDVGPAYTLTSNTSAVSLSDGPATIESGFRAAGTKTVHVLNIHLVSRTPAELARMANGKYSDTLTFSVAAD